ALLPTPTFALGEFNPNFILSDTEMQDHQSLTRADIQQFLDSRGSYLRSYVAEDANGTPKMAADIIYEAAQAYQINPKFLLVNLQKEQSLVTDDTPTEKQLNWAMGYAVCDSCSMDDPKIQKYKGFGKQVDNAAGIIRWYYENKDRSYIKKKDTPVRIDDQEVIPGSWATGFLYTYTPHLHGNKNFWRIWNTWFQQVYPNGSLLQVKDSTDVWLIQNGIRRRFKNKTALITRADPKMIVAIPESELSNYKLGTEISFPNYSILRVPSGTTYLLDYDTLRPFASNEVVGKLGFNPQEIVDIEESDIQGLPTGQPITADTIAPQGVIYQITDLNNIYYLLKDNVLQPIMDKRVVEVNYKNIKIEKRKRADLSQYTINEFPLQFKDGTLLKTIDSTNIYVIDQGKKRLIADEDTFLALGYKRTNIVTVPLGTLLNIAPGETLYVNSSLLSSKEKFLGDSESLVPDMFKTKLPSYLVAEYPSGRIISGKNIDTRRSVASFTKLLTAYEALNQNYKLTGTTVYNSKKYAIDKNTFEFKDGEKIKNKDIFTAMLVASVNNTARMVAQGTGLTEPEFVQKINERLENWGADNTTIADVTGLDSKNKSTARDLLKIFTKITGNKTIKDTMFTTEYSFKEVVSKDKKTTHAFKHTNQLITTPNRNYRILASKTGYTEEAGSILVMLIESRKTKKQYVIITLGGTSDAKKRFDEPNKIATWIAKGDVKISSK
ncbi:MAG TPA: serine hydrolase, partial [Patescibacteria group bacterium]|nr:serine hydrolase [Patescibacteria group bacterium]